MLDKMRSNSQSWLIYFIFGVIILVFGINFGPGFDQLSQQGCTPANKKAVATVNGDTIPRRLFLFRWRNFVSSQQIPASILQSMDFKGRMINQMIDQILLSQLARKYGFVATDKEVDDLILANPSFNNRKGHFDPTIFRRFVSSYYGMTTHSYKEFLKYQILSTKIRNVINAGVNVSAQEVKADYVMQNDKVQLSYLEVDTNKVKSKKTFSKKDIAAFIKSSNKKIGEYYRSHLNEFVTKRKVRVRQIIFKTGKDKKKAAKRKAALEKLRAELLKKPQKFSAYAKKHSEGLNKSKGGDIGFVTRSDLGLVEGRAIFAMKKKLDISKVQKTSLGYALYQLVEDKPAGKRALTDKSVKSEIAKKLLAKDDVTKQAKSFVASVLASAKKGGSFEKFAAPYIKSKKKSNNKLYQGKLFNKKQVAEYLKANQAKVTEFYKKNPSFFVLSEKKVRARHILFKSSPGNKDGKKKKAALEKLRQQLLKAPQTFADVAKKKSEGPSKVRGGDLGFFTYKAMVPPFSKAAFALKKANDISGVVKTRFGFHIIQLVATQSAKTKPFADPKVQEDIARTLLFQGLKKTSHPLFGYVKTDKTDLFTKDAVVVSGIGESKELTKKAFALTQKSPFLGQPLVIKGKVYAVRLLQRKKPDMKKFGTEKKKLKKKLLTKKRNDVVDTWLQKLRDEANITKDQKLLGYGGIKIGGKKGIQIR